MNGCAAKDKEMIMNNGLKIATNLVILVDIHECSNLKG
jgi:hypothetical protein